MAQIIRPKTHEEWLAIRQLGIGSSDVGTILGLNPYETPYQWWRQRKSGESKAETFAMRAGHYLEDAVARFWVDATNRKVIKSSAGDWLYRSTEAPHLQASPDRLYWTSDSRKAKGILECKTTQRTIDADDLPKTWFCQVQYQMGVAEIESASIAWLTAGREFGFRDLQFNPQFYKWLTEQVNEFWQRYIVGDEEPPMTTAADVLLKYPKHTEERVIECSEEVALACDKFNELRDQLKSIEAEQDKLLDKIKLAFDDAEAITFGGKTLATWRASAPRKQFDHKAYLADHPEVMEQYTIARGGERRLLVKR